MATATQYLTPVGGEQLKTWLAATSETASSFTIEDATVKVWQGNHGGSAVMVGRAPTGEVAILSAAHVFTNTGPAKIVLRDGSEFKAWVYDLDRRTDVALLAAEVPLEREVVITPVAEKCPAPGATAIKLGYPAYARGKQDGRWGEVVAPSQSFLFQASTYVQSGDSGGGVFCKDGKLISIVSGFRDHNPNQMYGSGTEALHAMVTKHGWGSCIFGRLREKRDGKDRVVPKPKDIIKKLFPKPPKDEPEVLPEPIKPPAVDLSAILLEIAALRKEIAAVKGTPGPQGPAGVPGKPGATGPAGIAGPPGTPADAVKIAALEAELEKLRKTTYIAELLDLKGSVMQRVSFGQDQPLRLKLVPVQPAPKK